VPTSWTAGHVRCRRIRRVIVIGCLTTAAITSCSSPAKVRVDQPGTGSPSGSPTASETPSPTPSLTVEQQVLAQYRAFWVVLPEASQAPVGQRKQILARYAGDPELRSLLDGMAEQDRLGRVFYGQNLPRPDIEMLSVGRGVAVVRDCQDSSGAGVQDAKSGQKLTVGVARNSASATLHPGTDGAWRVVFVTYPETSC
jgi:hypothetical protein